MDGVLYKAYHYDACFSIKKIYNKISYFCILFKIGDILHKYYGQI